MFESFEKSATEYFEGMKFDGPVTHDQAVRMAEVMSGELKLRLEVELKAFGLGVEKLLKAL